MAKSYFAVLEVSPGASSDEIRSAYRRLAKEFHPDYYDGGSTRFQQIQEAYSVISDPDKRNAYEKTLSGIPIQRPVRPTKYPEPEPLRPRSGFAEVEPLLPRHTHNTFSPAFGEIDEIFDRLWGFFTSY
jgi:curved DNA-binding protein CbpA